MKRFAIVLGSTAFLVGLTFAGIAARAIDAGSAKALASSGTSMMSGSMGHGMMGMSSCSKMDAMMMQPGSGANRSMMMHGMMASMTQMQENMMHMQSMADADRDFVTLALANAQSAISAASAEVRTGKNDKLKATARNIITAKCKTLVELQEMMAH
jgi:hypothetical protein